MNNFLLITCIFLILIGIIGPIKTKENDNNQQFKRLKQTSSFKIELENLFDRLNKLFNKQSDATKAKHHFDEFGMLINSREFSCEETHFDQLSRVIRLTKRIRFVDSDLIRNLANFEQLLLNQCKTILDTSLQVALNSLNEQDKIAAIRMVDTIKLPTGLAKVNQPSRVAMAQSRHLIAPNIVDYLNSVASLNELVIQNGESSPEERSKERIQFKLAYETYLSELCERILAKVKPAIRVYDHLQASSKLDEQTLNWVQAVKVCRIIEFLGFIGEERAFLAFKGKKGGGLIRNQAAQK